MGREIRRVPLDWEHPTQECKHSPWAGGCDYAKAHGGQCYKPLYDDDYHSAAREWIESFDLWRKGEHPDQAEYCTYYWEYSSPPNEEDYRARAWTADEATAYQVYETVSEGTPVSPVFATLDALIAWLIQQGHSAHAARAFAESGWAPSIVMYCPNDDSPGSIAMGIDTFDLM